MTAALTLYSGTFMRYAFAVTPKNYLLFACHFVNFGAQLAQGYRYLNYWNYGGREKSLEAQAKAEMRDLKGDGKQLLEKGKDMAEQVKDKVMK
ncbi:MAG: hypothetical protein M1830_003443 [Pleopsidium flavum]|nr:MAG: hypothetical protein M1830_003443 [Pleopsidium flavum]